MSIILHAGANAATIDQVREVATPASTDTWFPLPHDRLIDTVREQLTAGGFRVQQAQYGLWGDAGERMFATFELTNGQNPDDYSLLCGLRNSHDQAFSAGLAVGSHVFVCDNLAFSGEITIARKHTRFISRDLFRLTAEAVGKIAGQRQRQDERIAAYKGKRIGDARVHDLLIRSVDAKVIANAQIAKVLEQWRNPAHREFKRRSVWSLFNAYTEVLKDSNQLELPKRTTRLHGLMDLQVGLQN